eukprot:909312_1
MTNSMYTFSLLFVIHIVLSIDVQVGVANNPELHTYYDIVSVVVSGTNCALTDGLYSQIYNETQQFDLIPKRIIYHYYSERDLQHKLHNKCLLVFKHATNNAWMLIVCRHPGYHWAIGYTESDFVFHGSSASLPLHGTTELTISGDGTLLNTRADTTPRVGNLSTRIRCLEHQLAVQNNQSLSAQTADKPFRVQTVADANEKTFWMLIALIFMILLCQVLSVWCCQVNHRKKYQVAQMQHMMERNTILSIVLDHKNRQIRRESMISNEEGDMVTITDPLCCEDFGDAVKNARVADEMIMNDVVDEMIADELEFKQMIELHSCLHSNSNTSQMS